MITRLKVYCSRVAQLKVTGWYTKDKSDKMAELRFNPVTSGSVENESFFNSTPTGNIEFTTVNSAIADQFEPGKEYYIDISPAV